MNEAGDPVPPAFPGIGGWTHADSDAALAEGWDVFDCDGSENGRFQLCRCDVLADTEDGEPIFAEDEDAWAHVVAQARANSLLHVRALAFIARHNPWEAVAIDLRCGWVA